MYVECDFSGYNTMGQVEEHSDLKIKVEDLDHWSKKWGKIKNTQKEHVIIFQFHERTKPSIYRHGWRRILGQWQQPDIQQNHRRYSPKSGKRQPTHPYKKHMKFLFKE